MKTDMTVTFTKLEKHHRAALNLIQEADELMKLPLTETEPSKFLWVFSTIKVSELKYNLARINDSLLVSEWDYRLYYREPYYYLKQFRSLEVGSVVTMAIFLKNLIDEWSFDEN